MQIDGVQPKTDAHDVMYVYAAGPGRAADPHMVGYDIEAKGMAFIDDRLPERLFRRWRNLAEEAFEFEVVKINGHQDGAHQAECG